MSNHTISVFQYHPFHLVTPSPWPIYTSFSLLGLTTIGVLTINGFNYSYILLLFSLLSLIFSMSLWFRDITTEATYMGDHTLVVQIGLNLGIGLFIVSEALFFLAIFWTYFHTSLSPIIEVGTHWPPYGIDSINPFELPLLNTVILLASGVAVTYGHHSLIEGDRHGTLIGTIITVILAVIFTLFQGIEYSVSSFSISDATYGSIFFFGTGFHGFHVMIGTAFIGVGLWRMYAYHVTDNHHIGVESSILYWHFVDIIWLVLFVSIYYWGSEMSNDDLYFIPTMSFNHPNTGNGSANNNNTSTESSAIHYHEDLDDTVRQLNGTNSMVGRATTNGENTYVFHKISDTTNIETHIVPENTATSAYVNDNFSHIGNYDEVSRIIEAFRDNDSSNDNNDSDSDNNSSDNNGIGNSGADNSGAGNSGAGSNGAANTNQRHMDTFLETATTQDNIYGDLGKTVVDEESIWNCILTNEVCNLFDILNFLDILNIYLMHI